MRPTGLLGCGTFRKVNPSELVTLGQPLGSEEGAFRTGGGAFLKSELEGPLGKI